MQVGRFAGLDEQAALMDALVTNLKLKMVFIQSADCLYPSRRHLQN